MYQYRDEAAFSQALLRSWKNRNLGYRATRIESPTTERGISDLNVTTTDYEYWIELKREKRDFFGGEEPISIGWRPGQQNWLLEKFIASGRQRPHFTFVAFNDCIIAITMNKRYKEDKIYRRDASHIWYSIGEVAL